MSYLKEAYPSPKNHGTDDYASYCAADRRLFILPPITDNVLYQLISNNTDAQNFINEGSMNINPLGNNFNANSDYVVSRTYIPHSIYPSKNGGSRRRPRTHLSARQIRNGVYIRRFNINITTTNMGNGCSPIFHIFNSLRILGFTTTMGRRLRLPSGTFAFGGIINIVERGFKNSIRIVDNQATPSTWFVVNSAGNFVRRLNLISTTDPLSRSTYWTTNGILALNVDQSLFVQLATIVPGAIPVLQGTVPEPLGSPSVGRSIGNLAYFTPGVIGIYSR